MGKGLPFQITMKSFNKIFAGIITLIIFICIICNLCLLNISENSSREYRVEANRIAYDISKYGIDAVDLAEYSSIISIVQMNDTNKEDFFNAESDYVIREINGEIYRIEYTAQKNETIRLFFIFMNIILVTFSILIMIIIIMISQKILKPFFQLRDAPYELSRGNLTVPIKENKNRLFGKFTWGIDLLREKLEHSKKKELELQKEKKTLLLSLSHDIKTPLSAIKLYSKALSKGLYTDHSKQIEIAESINTKADQIEAFVSEIIRASNEDFLHLEVKMGEFYLSQIVAEIFEYYQEKLTLISIDFTVGNYTDCILKGDADRVIETLQNIIENAIKYGDGKNISIDFSDEEDCKLITVKNSGATLAETELHHIFESFWRGSNVKNQPGSGLGLYICRQLIHKMGGEIFAEMNGEFLSLTIVLNKV